MVAHTLSIYGLTTHPNSVLRTVFSWYTDSHENQTIFHEGQVQSLKRDLRASNNDPDELTKLVEDSLHVMVSNYIPGGTLNVEVLSEVIDNKIYLHIDITLKVGGINAKLSEVLPVDKQLIYEDSSIYEEYYKNINFKF